MTATTQTLAEFLLAQIAADEAMARVCAEVFPSPWNVNDRGYRAAVVADAPNFWPVAELDQEHEAEGRWPGEHLEHIARHDPAHVLAVCEAHRRIVEEHADYGGYGESCQRCQDGPIDLVPYPCPTLRALAAIYADRAGWREEWR